MSITAIWLNECNYFPCTKSVKVFLRAKKQYRYLTDDSPDSADPTFANWDAKDAQIRMWNSVEPTINSSLVYLDTTKQV